jgi:glycosyl transferase family 2
MTAAGSSPDLSVVVPSVNGWGDLEGCLRALEAQRPDARLEVLVVDRMGNGIRGRVRRDFPAVRLLEADPGTTIPAMRAMAFAAATGRSVAVIEDHVLVPPGWARALLEAQGGAEVVIGGAVENAATLRLVDWAAFLCEYHHLIPPLPAGPVTGVTGNNTLYPRALLVRYEAAWRAGRWENYLHDALRQGGVELRQHPEIVVGHKKHYTVREYLSQRYWYARSYAGARVEGQPWHRRLLFGLAACALPPVLLFRIIRAVTAKRRHLGHLVASLPLLLLFVSGWALGEVVGYWFGPGLALSRVC